MPDMINPQVSDLVPMAQSSYSYTPSTFEQLVKWAELVKDSQLIPAPYRGKPADILIAAQYGSEVGLKPLNAMHGIMVLNGKPSLYGDALLAVCQSSPDWEWHEESQTEESATCIVKRRNNTPHKVVFTKQDAITAGLWGKTGPWRNSPKRMLQMRARAFALRDKFSDALKGFCSAEEQQDIITIKKAEVIESELVREDQIYLLNSLLKDLNKDDAYVQKILQHQRVSKIEELKDLFVDKWIEALDKESWETIGQVDENKGVIKNEAV